MAGCKVATVVWIDRFDVPKDCRSGGMPLFHWRSCDRKFGPGDRISAVWCDISRVVRNHHSIYFQHAKQGHWSHWRLEDTLEKWVSIPSWCHPWIAAYAGRPCRSFLWPWPCRASAWACQGLESPNKVSGLEHPTDFPTRNNVFSWICGIWVLGGLYFLGHPQ